MFFGVCITDRTCVLPIYQCYSHLSLMPKRGLCGAQSPELDESQTKLVCRPGYRLTKFSAILWKYLMQLENTSYNVTKNKPSKHRCACLLKTPLQFYQLKIITWHYLKNKFVMVNKNLNGHLLLVEFNSSQHTQHLNKFQYDEIVSSLPDPSVFTLAFICVIILNTDFSRDLSVN